ncbi:hypothetical protein [Pantoea sp. Fr+CA_20]|uniref:hypothetical protein n=1 Tax=Pantoea TaxID=53335 RepID=UPI002118C4FB|nr:hypothetical protein [Pantoea sp. Fr+CA_20]
MLAFINFFTSQLQPDSQNQPNSALDENSGREKNAGHTVSGCVVLCARQPFR